MRVRQLLNKVLIRPEKVDAALCVFATIFSWVVIAATVRQLSSGATDLVVWGHSIAACLVAIAGTSQLFVHGALKHRLWLVTAAGSLSVSAFVGNVDLFGLILLFRVCAEVTD